MIDRVIEMTILSAPTRLIKHGRHELRSQLNTLFIAPYGAAKTTLSRQIEREELGVRITRYTEAAILGTITRKGELVYPSIIRGAGKVVMIDEFQNVPSRLRDILLSLLEEQLAERSLSFQAIPMQVSRPFYTIKVYGGTYQINIRCSFLITTMKISLQRVQDLALLSRCFPLCLGFSYEDAEDIIKGKRELSFSAIKKVLPEFTNTETEVPERTSDLIWNMVKKYAKACELEAGHALRAYGDLIRIANVVSILDGHEKIQYYEELPIYAQIYFLGVKGSELGYREHVILKYISDMGRITFNQLKEELPYSHGQIAYSLRLLREKKLVDMNTKEVWTII